MTRRNEKPVILTIGYEQYLVPTLADAQAVFAALSKSLRIQDYTWDRERPRVILESTPKLEIKLLRECTIVRGDDGEEEPMAPAEAVGTGLIPLRPSAVLPLPRRVRFAKP